MSGDLLTRSVRAYLTDPATRAGVDALLAIEPHSLPPEIEWQELGDYLGARAVAELTRSEFALALYSIWLAVWAPLIPEHWNLRDPDELLDEGQSVSPGEIWDEKAFSVFHRFGDLTLFTLVGFHKRRITLAFALERRDRSVIKSDLGSFKWRADGVWERWMLLTPGVAVEGDHAIDLRTLRAAARNAIAAVEGTPKPAKRLSTSRRTKRA